MHVNFKPRHKQRDRQHNNSKKEREDRNSKQREICRYFQEHGKCRHGDKCKFVHNFPSKAQAGNSSQGGKRERERGKGEREKGGKERERAKRVLKCWNCHEEGHRKQDCTKPARQTNNPPVDADADAVSFSDHSLAPHDETAKAVSFSDRPSDSSSDSPLPRDRKFRMFLDTACTHTMVKPGSLSCKQGARGTVTAANNGKMPVKSKGMLSLLTNQRKIDFSNVLEVDVAQNLLSVGGLANNGLTTVFTPTGAYVVRGELDLSGLELLCEGVREGNLWVLEGDLAPVQCNTETDATDTDHTQTEPEDGDTTERNGTDDPTFVASSSSASLSHADPCCDRPACAAAAVCSPPPVSTEASAPLRDAAGTTSTRTTAATNTSVSQPSVALLPTAAAAMSTAAAVTETVSIAPAAATVSTKPTKPTKTGKQRRDVTKLREDDIRKPVKHAPDDLEHARMAHSSFFPLSPPVRRVPGQTRSDRRTDESSSFAPFAPYNWFTPTCAN